MSNTDYHHQLPAVLQQGCREASAYLLSPRQGYRETSAYLLSPRRNMSMQSSSRKTLPADLQKGVHEMSHSSTQRYDAVSLITPRQPSPADSQMDFHEMSWDSYAHGYVSSLISPRKLQSRVRKEPITLTPTFVSLRKERHHVAKRPSPSMPNSSYGQPVAAVQNKDIDEHSRFPLPWRGRDSLLASYPQSLQTLARTDSTSMSNSSALGREQQHAATNENTSNIAIPKTFERVWNEPLRAEDNSVALGAILVGTNPQQPEPLAQNRRCPPLQMHVSNESVSLSSNSTSLGQERQHAADTLASEEISSNHAGCELVAKLRAELEHWRSEYMVLSNSTNSSNSEVSKLRAELEHLRYESLAASPWLQKAQVTSLMQEVGKLENVAPSIWQEPVSNESTLSNSLSPGQEPLVVDMYTYDETIANHAVNEVSKLRAEVECLRSEYMSLADENKTSPSISEVSNLRAELDLLRSESVAAKMEVASLKQKVGKFGTDETMPSTTDTSREVFVYLSTPGSDTSVPSAVEISMCSTNEDQMMDRVECGQPHHQPFPVLLQEDFNENASCLPTLPSHGAVPSVPGTGYWTEGISETYQIGDCVEVRGQPLTDYWAWDYPTSWTEGIVKRIDPLQVTADGWLLAHTWPEVRSMIDTPGIYEILSEEAAVGTKCEDGHLVSTLWKGDVVNVLEVRRLENDIRGRIANPKGWISLLPSSLRSARRVANAPSEYC